MVNQEVEKILDILYKEGDFKQKKISHTRLLAYILNNTIKYISRVEEGIVHDIYKIEVDNAYLVVVFDSTGLEGNPVHLILPQQKLIYTTYIPLVYSP